MQFENIFKSKIKWQIIFTCSSWKVSSETLNFVSFSIFDRFAICKGTIWYLQSHCDIYCLMFFILHFVSHIWDTRSILSFDILLLDMIHGHYRYTFRYMINNIILPMDTHTLHLRWSQVTYIIIQHPVQLDNKSWLNSLYYVKVEWFKQFPLCKF